MGADDCGEVDVSDWARMTSPSLNDVDDFVCFVWSHDRNPVFMVFEIRHRPYVWILDRGVILRGHVLKWLTGLGLQSQVICMAIDL